MKQSIGKALLLMLLLLSVSKGVNVYQCDSITNELKVVNDGTTIEHYTIQKSGIPASWTIITPMTFTLLPGQSRVLTALTSINCNERTGDYILTIKAISDNNVITKDYPIRVLSSHFVSVINSEGIIDECVNTNIAIPLTIINEGKFDEDINLTTSDGVLSVNSLRLRVNESRELRLYYKPTTSGVKSIKITAFYSGLKSESVININSNECNTFNAYLTNNYINLCENDNKTTSLIITNNGESNNFYLNTSSPYLNFPSQVYLESNQTRVINLTVNSGCDSGLMNNTLSISARGAITKQVNLIINAKQCYKPIIVAQVLRDEACSCERVSYDYTIINPGQRETTYVLKSSYGELNKEVTLKPGESINETLNYTIPCDYKGELLLMLNATAISTCDRHDSEAIRVLVKGWDECENVKVITPRLIALNNSQLVIPVRIKNIGIRPASYNLMISGSLMNNLLSVSDGFITLNPGEEGVAELTLDSKNITGGYLLVEAYSVDNAARSNSLILFTNQSTINYLIIIIVSALSLIIFLIHKSKKQDNTKK